jgi:hypothetical protein
MGQSVTADTPSRNYDTVNRNDIAAQRSHGRDQDDCGAFEYGQSI